MIPGLLALVSLSRAVLPLPHVGFSSLSATTAVGAIDVRWKRSISTYRASLWILDTNTKMLMLCIWIQLCF